MILAIDPGRMKCGLAFFSDQGKFVRREPISTNELLASFSLLIGKNEVIKAVIGSGAFGQKLSKQLKKIAPQLPIIFVSEKNSTWLARQLFWQLNPPRGWRRFIPRSLIFPPVPIDPYAAQIIGERYFFEL